MKSIFALSRLGFLGCLSPPAAAEAAVCHGKNLTQIAGLAAHMAKRAGDLVNADGVF